MHLLPKKNMNCYLRALLKDVLSCRNNSPKNVLKNRDDGHCSECLTVNAGNLKRIRIYMPAESSDPPLTRINIFLQMVSFNTPRNEPTNCGAVTSFQYVA